MGKIVPIIDLPCDRIAKRVIVCGDPKRAEKIALDIEDEITIALESIIQVEA